MSAIRVRGVTKRFGSVPALEGVDLDVAQGSLTAVLGPSGCGKTTLLRLIAGFLAPDAGTISLDDREVAGPHRGVPARERRVGYVPQEGALFPHLSIAANIGFGLPRRDRGRADRLAELLDLVGLPADVALRYPDELSGGQQQRAALARALAPRPEVVLLDEPFSSLDAGLREDTGRAVARALRASGSTAVLVTHDQGEALSLADQVAVLRAGRLVQAGPPGEVYRHPADVGVASFVGGAVVLAGEVAGGYVSSPLGRLELLAESPPGPVDVVVRPEQIALGADGAPARVVEVIYYGHDAAVHLQLQPGGQTVTARLLGALAPAVGTDTCVLVRGPVAVFIPR